jgi:hypothetical protein
MTPITTMYLQALKLRHYLRAIGSTSWDAFVT